jgi:hypothetical protein
VQDFCPAQDGSNAAVTTPAEPTGESTGPEIPDFEKDAASITAYQEARQRFERREMQDAESKIRSQYAKRREAIRAEIAVAGSLLEQRVEKAQKALAAYARRYPKRMDRNKALKPSFMETLLSMGAAGRMYRATQRTAAEASDAHNLRRRKEHDEEELETQLKRALYLQEDSLKKRLTSQDGIDVFHKRPGVEILWKRVEEIRKERVTYLARLERGEVPPAEQRDRDFAERKIHPLEMPFAGVLITQIASYGDLHYVIVRDLEKQLFALPYDPRLEPLLDQVFDVFRLADTYEAKLRRGSDNKPFTALDHFFACFKDEETARHEYRKQRTQLRQPRDLPAMPLDNPADQATVDLLVAFARTIGPPAPASFSPPQA